MSGPIQSWTAEGGKTFYICGNRGVMTTFSAVYRDHIQTPQEDNDVYTLLPNGFIRSVPNTTENFAAAMQWLEEDT